MGSHWSVIRLPRPLTTNPFKNAPISFLDLKSQLKLLRSVSYWQAFKLLFNFVCLPLKIALSACFIMQNAIVHTLLVFLMSLTARKYPGILILFSAQKHSHICGTSLMEFLHSLLEKHSHFYNLYS